NVMSELKRQRPDIILTASINRYAVPGETDPARINATVADGFERYWRDLSAAGLHIAAMKDLPFMPFDVPDCMARRHATSDGCSAPASRVIQSEEPQIMAARALPQVE